MLLFYYSQLSEEAKKVYGTVYSALSNGRIDIKADLSRLRDGDIEEVITAVFNDHPELYVEDGHGWQCRYTNRGLRFSHQIKSIYNDKEEMENLLKFSDFTRKSCHGEYEIVKHVHDFVINSVKYDRNEADGGYVIMSNHSAIGALCTGKSVCEGIARLTQLLLGLCGVQATYCSGRLLKREGKGEEAKLKKSQVGHGWNVVCIDGSYYHLDVSHDVCRTAERSQRSYCYFNLPHRDIVKDRALDRDELFRRLPCRTEGYNYFHYNNCFFTSLPQLSAALYGTLQTAASGKRTSRFYQFRISDALQKELRIPWNKLCLSEIYRAVDRFSAENREIKVSFDEPSHVPLQGVMSVNFTFEY